MYVKFIFQGSTLTNQQEGDELFRVIVPRDWFSQNNNTNGI